MSEPKKSRARNAGESLGSTIRELANLFYNKRTKKEFFVGLLTTLQAQADFPDDVTDEQLLEKYGCHSTEEQER